ncbi:MAG TPA: asparagine synthase (glutamine-hydrolyzing), partial [Lentisphaeria bacterium]|nr:asparagine synthase (glutamine-hydrolyzing) [Lentisphaeria bacterium]
MCGIAGIFRKDYQPVDLQTLEAMADAMLLRGPDGTGFHVDGPFGLAHRRLSILDLAGGAQPIANEDNTVFTVVNGEFYNYPELRKSLERKGHRFRTNSDSECAVHLYEEYGTAFPEHLTGMFALAVYDARKKSLFLVRDRAGEKPLFLLNTKELFAFASDLNALKRIPGVDWQLNYDALADYLMFMYTPGRATVYRNVTRLEPGKSLLISANATAFQSYWTLNPETRAEVGFGTAAQRVREMVTESVRSSLLADVPLGVFLSGGLDSTIIAAAASQVESPEPLRCFSIGFNDPAYDESRQAERNAEYLRKR